MASRGLTLVSSTPTPTPNPGLPTRLSADASKINAAASFIIWPNTLQAASYYRQHANLRAHKTSFSSADQGRWPHPVQEGRRHFLVL